MRPHFHLLTPSPNSIGDAGSYFAISGQHGAQQQERAKMAHSRGYNPAINGPATVNRAEINHFESLRRPADLSGTNLAQWSSSEIRVRKATALNVIARQTCQMNPVALLTTTCGRDLCASHRRPANPGGRAAPC
jgi:hypothetical protein